MTHTKAQNLKSPVTTTGKLKYSHDQRIYIMRDIVPVAETKSLDQNSFKFEPITIDGETTNLKAFGGMTGSYQRPQQKVIAVGMIKMGPKTLFVNVLSIFQSEKKDLNS
jgi:hypothetical protein